MARELIELGGGSEGKGREYPKAGESGRLLIEKKDAS
jgi:hypothetical protein